MAEGDFRFYDMFSPWEEFRGSIPSPPLKSMPETGAVNEARLLPCHLILGKSFVKVEDECSKKSLAVEQDIYQKELKADLALGTLKSVTIC